MAGPGCHASQRPRCDPGSSQVRPSQVRGLSAHRSLLAKKIGARKTTHSTQKPLLKAGVGLID
eukprot:SAG25_NODE_320_length_9927_cov_18.459402_9_plen_63_part_00